jgi:hypothetical protein
MVTNAQWLSAWKTISIAGVTSLTTPPASLDRVKLPAGWPQELTAGLGTVLVSCLGANLQRRIVYHIAVGAVGQKNLSINYDETAALMDAIETAVKALHGVLVNFLEFQIFLTDKIIVAGIPYWGFEIQATGRNV